MDLYSPGELIGDRYQVMGRPLQGGMGVVYFCMDQQLWQPVALKTFRPEYLSSRKARDLFLREGRYWVEMGSHPHVVQAHVVFHFGVRNEVFLVLEWVTKEQGHQNASLRSWLREGQRLSIETALLFALQITRGMRHAASSIPGFVHRDLKPENVLVGADRLTETPVNRLRVTDFGLAVVLESVEQEESPVTDASSGDRQHPSPDQMQLTNGVAGTPRYMAPEQWNGGELGAWTDVYALGCILYEMVTGQHAALGHSKMSLREAHCSGRVARLLDEVPVPARTIVARCLARGGSDRYQCWGDVEAALGAAYRVITKEAVPATITGEERTRWERISVGWSYNSCGSGYLDISKAKVAAKHFEQALEVGRAEGERRLEGAALNNLGEASRSLGDAQRAIGYYEQSLMIAQEVGDRRLEGAALGNLGIAHLQLSDARRAIGCHEQSLTIVRELGDRQAEGAALGNLGNAYLQLSDVQRAKEFYEQGLVIAQEIGDRQAEGNALGNLGITYAQLGDVRQAIEHYEQCLVIAREVGDRHREGLVLGGLGNVHRGLDDTQRAIGYHEQSLAIAREVGDQRAEGWALGCLGTAYARLGDTQRAISYYEQRLMIAREIGDRHGESITLGNLGNAYSSLGDARRAIGHYERRLAIAREIGDRRGEGTTLGNLGNTYSRLGDARRALSYYEQALVVRREIGARHMVASVLYNMAALHARQGDPARALPLAREAAYIYAQTGLDRRAKQAQQLVVQLKYAGKHY